MELSRYQQEIIDWAKNGTGHGCCNAVAGSGKSTTLRLVAEALTATDYINNRRGYTPSEIKICVFGKANATDLIAKFGNQWKESISTLHSAGWSLIKSHLNITNAQDLVKGNKCKHIAQGLGLIASRGNPSPELRREGAIAKDEDFLKLIDLVRLTNSCNSAAIVLGGWVKAEVVQEICLHFEIPDIYDFERVALSQS